MDNNLPDLEASETTHENVPNSDKLIQSYLLLKQRIFGIDELIKKYNDKSKECERLRQNSDTLNDQFKEVTYNYNSILAKKIKLELQNRDFEKNIETLTTQVNEFKTKTAADKQHIQQLICKIEDIERNQNDKIMQYDLEKSSLQVKVKELEQELKNVKKSHDTKMKKMEKKLPTENDKKTKLKDAETNTTLTKDILMIRPEVSEKSVLTDEFYNVKDDIYPVFCGKCEVLLEPPPLEKICKIMSDSCPKLIEKISSPPKKPSSPLRVSTEINNEQCKTESLPALSDNLPPHIQNQNNHADFIPTNLLPPHTISLSRTGYCNTFSPASNLINQGSYYIGPTSVNPLSMTNSNAADQSSHGECMATISSLQKRLDTLETKLEKKLFKVKSEQNSNCCQHHRRNACCVYDTNNSIQFNLVELWKSMTDFCENKKRKNSNAHKTLKKYKLSRSKFKRLQSTHTGSWKVESVAEQVQRTFLKKKSKQRKSRCSLLFNKSDDSTNNTENFETLNGDSDADSSIDVFNDTGGSKASIDLKSNNVPYIKGPTSITNRENTNMNETEVDIVRSSIECSKSTGGETDSGILSDSIESGKLMQLEADTDTCLELTEQRNAIEIKSSMQSEPCFPENIKFVNESLKSNRPTEGDNALDPLSKPDERIEKTEHRTISETSQFADLVVGIKENNFITSHPTRKRKMNDLPEIKMSNSQQKLLKKSRNLRKSSKIVRTYQNPSEYHDTQNHEHKDLDYNSDVVKEDDYTPKKKPRIAHVPKNTLIDQKKPLNDSLQFRKPFVKSVENMVAQTMQRSCVDSNKLIGDNNGLQKIGSDNIEEPRSTLLNVVHSCDTQSVVKHDVDEILIPGIENSMSDLESKNSLETDSSNCDQFELNETKTESNSRHEYEEHKHKNNSLDVKEISDTSNTSEQELLNSIHRHSAGTVELNNANETNLNTTEEIMNDTYTRKEDSTAEYKLKSYSPIMKLQEYINENKKKQYQNFLHVRVIDKFVKKQLQRLVDSDGQSSIHWDVIEKLKTTCSARIIAKGVIDFLSIEQECNRTLDKSHTPPAPIMTKAQQKIVALLTDLEECKSTVFQLVQAGIEFKLFRLSQPMEKSVVESLARMYTVLTRIKKDREKVRIFCCDALYCLGLNAIIVLHTVFVCWPEVFPNNETNSELLPKCMAHLIMAQQATDFPKLHPLKNLVSVFYKYPMGTLSKNFLKELLTALREKRDGGIETAIILLAKREGTAWTYKNVIKGALLPMIINNELPSTYRAFSLLGNLMRVFPIEDKDNSVGEIIEQLCDLINSGEGSDEQKEGVISALFSLSRHKFNEVLENTLKWTLSVPMRDRTIQQIKGLSNMRDTDFWKAYLKKNRQLLAVLEKSKT